MSRPSTLRSCTSADTYLKAGSLALLPASRASALAVVLLYRLMMPARGSAGRSSSLELTELALGATRELGCLWLCCDAWPEWLRDLQAL